MGALQRMCCKEKSGAPPQIHRINTAMLPWQVPRLLSRRGGGWMPSLLAQALEAPLEVLPGVSLLSQLFASFAHGSGMKRAQYLA